MKFKVLSMLLITACLVTMNFKTTKVDIIHAQVESRILKKHKDEIRKEKKKEKQREKEREKKRKKQEQLDYFSNLTGKKVVKVTKKTIKISFYTDLDCENYEGCGGLTASGVKLYDGVVANNSYSFGTDLYIKGYGLKEVLDRGGRGLYGDNFDVFVPRIYGESDSMYYRRVNNMGVKTVKAYFLEYAE